MSSLSLPRNPAPLLQKLEDLNFKMLLLRSSKPRRSEPAKIRIEHAKCVASIAGQLSEGYKEYRGLMDEYANFFRMAQTPGAVTDDDFKAAAAVFTGTRLLTGS